jgi:hypothetical protein
MFATTHPICTIQLGLKTGSFKGFCREFVNVQFLLLKLLACTLEKGLRFHSEFIFTNKKMRIKMIVKNMSYLFEVVDIAKVALLLIVHEDCQPDIGQLCYIC